MVVTRADRPRPALPMSPGLCGVYNPPDRMDVLDAMERWLGTRHAVHVVFTPWDSGGIDHLFGRLLPAVWNAGRVPLLTWEPYTPTPDETGSDVVARIAAGAFDGYLEAWAERLREWLAGPDGALGTADDRRCYLRFAHEMNGDWYPWSPSTAGTPADYIEMWRRVHDLVGGGLDESHCQWVWCVNHVDVGDHAAEACYPGDEFVDWVGVDGFNWGHSKTWSSWRSPSEVFRGTFDRLGRLTHKPVCVPEFASSSVTATSHDPVKKAAWIREAVAYLDERVQLWCWFNEDKETDWAVFGGSRGTSHADETVSHERYSAYRDAMTRLDGYEPTGPRLVSDAAFRGD